jgi:cation transport regulator ChaC
MGENNTRRYFAYGSNMDQAGMHHRCPGAVVVGTAVLRNYRFIINRRGVASVVPAATSNVYGVLWDITPSHEKALDDYEGVEEGWYYKTLVNVHTQGPDLQLAMIYIACEEQAGIPRRRYLDKIVAAAEYFGFPAAYLQELRSWRQG